MKYKSLLQILVVFTLVFSSFGVSASSNTPSTAADAIVINRSLSIWEGTYIGFVSSSVFEKWSLDLTEAHNFTVSVSTIAGDLVPLLTLQDSNGNEITHGTGSLTTSNALSLRSLPLGAVSSVSISSWNAIGVLGLAFHSVS